MLWRGRTVRRPLKHLRGRLDIVSHRVGPPGLCSPAGRLDRVVLPVPAKYAPMTQEPHNPYELVKDPVLRPRRASVPGFVMLVMAMALLFAHLGA